MKIAVLTTVFERYLITKTHFQWMQNFREIMADEGIDIIPFYALSSYDEFCFDFEAQLTGKNLDYEIFNEKSLSSKTQKAFTKMCSRNEFDYMMHLDSDEFISKTQMLLWNVWIKRKIRLFGSKQKVIFHLDDKSLYEFKGYNRHPIVNGGFCISKQVFESVSYNVWTPGINTGLNNNELISYSKRGYEPEVKDMMDFGIVEVKASTENQIHDLNWYQKGDYLTEIKDEFSLEMFYQIHPFLKQLAILY